MIYLVALAAAAAVLLVAIYVISSASERSEVRDSLRALESYQIAGVREQEMLAPASERILAPLATGVSNFGKRFTPVGYVEEMGRKWVLAGSPSSLSPERLLLYKGLGLLSLPLWFLLIWVLLGISGIMGLLMILVLWAASFFGSDALMERAVEARKQRIARQLPDVLDLLVISVEAGLGFEQALDRTVESIPGDLSDEFRRMLQEVRIGATRADALRALDGRTDVPELRSFILAMLQADTFGVSISRILKSQADELRIRRRFRIQEMAQKAPVKMLFPLVLCIFPSIFVVILGPAVIQVLDAFSGTG